RLCRRQPNAIGGTRDQDLLVVHGTAIQGYGPRAKRLQQHVRWSRRISLRDGDTIARLCGNRGLHQLVPTQQVRRGCQGAIVATMDWLYPLSGFVVGAIVGLTGMGGVSLLTVLLILFLGVQPPRGVAPALLSPAVRKTAGTAIHSKKGNVDWRVAGLLAAGSVPATVLTIWVLSRVPKQSPTTATIISTSMGVTLIITAVAIFFCGFIRDYSLARADNPTRTRYPGPITVVFGSVLGVLVSLCSV